jgi:hypothetical protein
MEMLPICPAKGTGCTFPKCECMVPLGRKVSTEKRMATDADRVFGTLPTMAEAEERLGAAMDTVFNMLPPQSAKPADTAEPTVYGRCDADGKRLPANSSELIAERQATHGTFADNCEQFARYIEAAPLEKFDRRTWYSVAAIYMKLARMASGQSTSRQHWEDVAGYGTLEVKEIDEGRLA